MRKRLELKGVIGPDDEDEKVMRVLNRVVTWTADGIVNEPDPRHAEIIVNQLQLDKCKRVVTPGEKDNSQTKDDEDGDRDVGDDRRRRGRKQLHTR